MECAATIETTARFNLMIGTHNLCNSDAPTIVVAEVTAKYTPPHLHLDTQQTDSRNHQLERVSSSDKKSRDNLTTIPNKRLLKRVLVFK